MLFTNKYHIILKKFGKSKKKLHLFSRTSAIKTKVNKIFYSVWNCESHNSSIFLRVFSSQLLMISCLSGVAFAFASQNVCTDDCALDLLSILTNPSSFVNGFTHFHHQEPSVVSPAFATNSAIDGE